MPGLRLESILGHCERHALLHMAPKWLDHWTTWAGRQQLELRIPERFHQNIYSCVYLQHTLATASHWLLVKVLHPTHHKIGHFRDALPSQSLD